jgi:hypothetical protein
VLLGAVPVPQLADLQRGQQWRVAREHAEVPLGAGQLDLVHLLVDERSFGRDDLEGQFGW